MQPQSSPVAFCCRAICFCSIFFQIYLAQPSGHIAHKFHFQWCLARWRTHTNWWYFQRQTVSTDGHSNGPMTEYSWRWPPYKGNPALELLSGKAPDTSFSMAEASCRRGPLMLLQQMGSSRPPYSGRTSLYSTWPFEWGYLKRRTKGSSASKNLVSIVLWYSCPSWTDWAGVLRHLGWARPYSRT